MPSKTDYTLYLKYFIFPFIFIITILLINILLIMPYLNLRDELNTTRNSKQVLIDTYEKKLVILRDAREKSSDVSRYLEKMRSLVPDDESPAPLVSKLDSTSANFRFLRVDENKNVADTNLAKEGRLEVRFNGRTVGALSAYNFLQSLNSDKDKIINLRDIELFDDRENKYYRVAFAARTIFVTTKPVVNTDQVVPDILNDKNFVDFIGRYLN